jgi:mRNA interferase MazF
MAKLLSPASYNGRVGLALLCPITNKVKGYPFEVNIPSGLGVSGVILADQVKSLDWRVRNAQLICSLPSATVTATLQKVNTLLH